MKRLRHLSPWVRNRLPLGKQLSLKRERPGNWASIRYRALCREPLCRICYAKGRRVLAREVDHIIPLSRGGGDKLINLQALCRECHEEKSKSEGENR